MDEIRSHHRRLTTRLLEGMESIGGVTVYGPRDADRRVGVVSIRVAGYHPQEVAATLDAVHSIQVRAGLHCAPLLHRALGTFPLGGAVRFSFGVFTTEREVDAAVHAVAEIAAASTT
jgi:selenocysteine lyase/cysteine desulfurase